MILGNIKDYKVCNLTPKKLEKDGFLNELELTKSDIKNYILDALKNKEIVYGLKRKNILKAVYIFNVIKKDDKKILKLKDDIHIADIDNKIIEEFENLISQDLSELVTEGEFQKIIFKDMEILPNERDKGFAGSTYALCLSLGVMFGIIFNQLVWGLLIGNLLGITLGSARMIKRKK